MEKLALATVSAAGLWYGANAIALFRWIATDAQGQLLVGLGAAGVLLAVAFLVHLGLTWAHLNGWLAAPAYLVAPVVWSLREGKWADIYHLWLLVAIGWAVALCVYAARIQSEDYRRRFFHLFAGALALIPLAAVVAPATVVLASLAPFLCFARFVYRYHFLGLLIGRRVVFALSLGVLFAFYLYVVWLGAAFVQDRWEAPGPLAAVALIFGGSLVWLPLYGWMTRFFSKRTQLYADLSKRLIEEAARIVDLEKRLQFIAQEVGRSFALSKVCLVTVGKRPVRGTFGPCTERDQPSVLEEVEKLVLERRVDLVAAGRDSGRDLPERLARLGFNYLFPLWYEDHLEGLLLLDTSPRLFLDENEPILLGLSRQISSSIETCRVIEEKIDLERQLLRQEHLASLGKVAATIAHEIKNPLSSVKTLAQLMREDLDVRRKYDRDLGYLIGETDRLNRSVQQLLSFSRPVPEKRQEVDLTDLLVTMAELLEREYAGRQIRIEHRIAPQLKMRHGSPELVKQIVLNLAINAIQATEPGGGVYLEAKVETTANVTISVRDQGPGIPAEIREQIFEPFFTTKQRGTGLGLAIVRKNVRQLGGGIRIQSPITEGRGTCVVITLPAL